MKWSRAVSQVGVSLAGRKTGKLMNIFSFTSAVGPDVLLSELPLARSEAGGVDDAALDVKHKVLHLDGIALGSGHQLLLQLMLLTLPAPPHRCQQLLSQAPAARLRCHRCARQDRLPHLSLGAASALLHNRAHSGRSPVSATITAFGLPWPPAGALTPPRRMTTLYRRVC